MTEGKNTRVALDNVTPLLLPWVADPWGKMRPPLSVEAMKLSAELSNAVYDMEVTPWLRAGWRDATIQAEDSLTPLESSESWLSSTWKKLRVRSRLRQGNPLGQVLGALRLRQGGGTGKAVVMLHPAPEGRYVVAVCFMGTGGRIYDWLSNLRMTSQDGAHRGFLQLAEQLEGNEEKISFPLTARELGLQSLTLRDVLQEMTSPGSRFTLWLSGHSQGAAVMQLYVHRKLTRSGVLPAHVVGYGFASPSVMTGQAVADPAAYPLYHVLNSDDMVPRCGALVHLGVCLTYPADETFRRRCYGWPRDEQAVRNRLLARAVLAHMNNTPAVLVYVLAYLNLLASRGPAELLAALKGMMPLGPLPLDKVIGAENVAEWSAAALRKGAAAYESITGRPLDRALLAEAQVEISAVMDQMGQRSFEEALMQLLRWPHSIAGNRADGTVGAYTYIARFGAESLVPSIWLAGTPPCQLLAGSVRPRLAGQADGLFNRHRQSVPRRVHRGLRYRDPRSRADTRHHTPVLQMGNVRAGEKLIRMK